MSLRRKSAPVQQDAPYAQNAFSVGSGLVTESGFGICEDGSIGFAGCVMKSCSGVAAAAPVSGPASVVETKTAMTTKTQKRSVVQSNRDAQQHMARMARGFPLNSGTETMMCTCPDGGTPLGASSVGRRSCTETMGGRYSDDDDEDDEDECDEDGRCDARMDDLFGNIIKHGKAAGNAVVAGAKQVHKTYKSSKPTKEKKQNENNQPGFMDRAKAGYHHVVHRKPLSTHAQEMNNMVFEAMTGKRYSPTAAKQHDVIDIFSTFPNGVPTHSSMTQSEIRRAEKISDLLHEARKGVATAVVMGVPLHPDHRKTMEDLASMLKNSNTLLKKVKNIIKHDDAEKKKKHHHVEQYKKQYDDATPEFKKKMVQEYHKTRKMDSDSLNTHDKHWMEAMRDKLRKLKKEKKKVVNKIKSENLDPKALAQAQETAEALNVEEKETRQQIADVVHAKVYERNVDPDHHESEY